ncbi:MAG: Crp/Fnr family transcriptional regulator [Geminicoccaceae bacterium]
MCAAVGPEFLPRLTAMATERRLAPEQSLFEEGEPVEASYVVTHGMLKLFKLLGDGRRQIVGFALPGDFLGLVVGELHGCTAEAVTEAELCRFPRAQFLMLCDECPPLEKEIFQRTSTELAAAQEQMMLLGRKNATERVASFVLSMRRRQRLGPSEPIRLPMSRVDIADHLGLTVETVSRSLSRLRTLRLIESLDRHLIRIRQEARLEEAAGARPC